MTNPKEILEAAKTILLVDWSNQNVPRTLLNAGFTVFCFSPGRYSQAEVVADYPDAYIDQPGFEVIKRIPGTWDETRVPIAEVDKYVSIARRRADKWYIGTISNNDGREVVLNFKFLPAGKFLL